METRIRKRQITGNVCVKIEFSYLRKNVDTLLCSVARNSFNAKIDENYFRNTELKLNSHASDLLLRFFSPFFQVVNQG